MVFIKQNKSLGHEIYTSSFDIAWGGNVLCLELHKFSAYKKLKNGRENVFWIWIVSWQCLNSTFRNDLVEGGVCLYTRNLDGAIFRPSYKNL